MAGQVGGGRGRRIAGLVAALVLVLVAIAALRVGPSILAARGSLPPVVDAVPPELPEGLGRSAPAILVFTKTAGFRHEEAIPAALASVRAIAARRGFDVFATENAAVFDDAQLARFRVLFADNTTGDDWSAAQKAAFQRYVEGGGGVVGVHGALGTSYRFWDWYTDVLFLGRFVGHPMFPQFQRATLHIEDRSHPAMEGFGATFEHEDEWYSFEKSARDLGAHVLATLDESTYRPSSFGTDLSMGDHPIIWCHCIGRGRVFYSALGHTAATYARPEHERMLEGALAWAAGLEGSCP